MVYQETMDKFLEHLKLAKLNSSSLMPVYGMAETTLAISFTDVNKGIQFLKVNKLALQNGKVLLDKNGESICCVGKVLPTFEIKLENGQGIKLSENEVGKIFVKGPCLTEGYIDQQGTVITFKNNDWLDYWR